MSPCSANSDETHFHELKHALQAFQSRRLRKTYADLMADPQYTRIGHFFFDQLYAPGDFSFRNTSMRTLHRLLDGKVYKGMVAAVSLVIELHDLSDQLDNEMACRMAKAGIDPAQLDLSVYRRIYTSLDNYDQRVYQIALAGRAVRAFHRLSQKWIVGLSLKTVRSAAHLLGIGRIMDFVHEGYMAYRAIDNIDYFVQTIEARELRWHDNIWHGDQGPPADP